MMHKNQAETVAIQALSWLADQEELFGSFLNTTGASVNDVRGMAADPAFLGSVLDFILMADNTVTGFCDSVGLPPETPKLARQFLPGGDMVNWT
jgi:uncharacterized protein DUF3572